MARGKTTKTDSAPAEKAPKTPTPAKKAVKAEAAPKKEAAATAAAAPEETAPPAAPEADDTLAIQSSEFLTKLQQVSALLTSLKTEYRALEKKWTRTLTVAQKATSKRKRKRPAPAPPAVS